MSEHSHTHTHVDENGHVYEHSHGHHHSHAQTKAVLNRLSRAQGHLDARAEDGGARRGLRRGAGAAQRGDLRAERHGRAILKDHISHCIVDAVEAGDQEAIQALNDAIDRFMR